MYLRGDGRDIDLAQRIHDRLSVLKQAASETRATIASKLQSHEQRQTSPTAVVTIETGPDVVTSDAPGSFHRQAQPRQAHVVVNSAKGIGVVVPRLALAQDQPRIQSPQPQVQDSEYRGQAARRAASPVLSVVSNVGSPNLVHVSRSSKEALGPIAALVWSSSPTNAGSSAQLANRGVRSPSESPQHKSSTVLGMASSLGSSPPVVTSFVTDGSMHTSNPLTKVIAQAPHSQFLASAALEIASLKAASTSPVNSPMSLSRSCTTLGGSKCGSAVAAPPVATHVGFFSGADTGGTGADGDFAQIGVAPTCSTPGSDRPLAPTGHSQSFLNLASARGSAGGSSLLPAGSMLLVGPNSSSSPTAQISFAPGPAPRIHGGSGPDQVLAALMESVSPYLQPAMSRAPSRGRSCSPGPAYTTPGSSQKWVTLPSKDATATPPMPPVSSQPIFLRGMGLTQKLTEPVLASVPRGGPVGKAPPSVMRPRPSSPTSSIGRACRTPPMGGSGLVNIGRSSSSGCMTPPVAGSLTSSIARSQTPLGSSTLPFSCSQTPLGSATLPIGRGQSPFGSAALGSATPPFGSATLPIGRSQTPLGSAMPPFGSATLPIGRSQTPLGSVTPPVGCRQTPLGSGLFPLGRSQTPLGSSALPGRSQTQTSQQRHRSISPSFHPSTPQRQCSRSPSPSMGARGRSPAPMSSVVGFNAQNGEAGGLPTMEKLKKNIETLNALRKANEERIHRAANQDKMQYGVALDQTVFQKEFMLTQGFKEQVMRLTQAAQARRADLEKAVCDKALGHQQKKVQDLYVEQQTQMEQEYTKEQAFLSDEIHRIREQHGPAPPLVDINPMLGSSPTTAQFFASPGPCPPLLPSSINTPARSPSQFAGLLGPCPPLLPSSAKSPVSSPAAASQFNGLPGPCPLLLPGRKKSPCSSPAPFMCSPPPLNQPSSGLKMRSPSEMAAFSHNAFAPVSVCGPASTPQRPSSFATGTPQGSLHKAGTPQGSLQTSFQCRMDESGVEAKGLQDARLLGYSEVMRTLRAPDSDDESDNA